MDINKAKATVQDISSATDRDMQALFQKMQHERLLKVYSVGYAQCLQDIREAGGTIPEGVKSPS